MSGETTPAARFKDEETVERYEARQNFLVPGRLDMYHAMLQMIALGGEHATLVDLGCGRATFSELVLERFPNLELILVDFSAAMLTASERQLSPYADRVSFLHADFGSDAWRSKLPGTVRGVVSSHAIHHLTDPRKAQLYREIYEATDKGGFFINGDLVRAEDPSVNTHFREVWVDFIFTNVSSQASAKDKAVARDDIRAKHYASQEEEGDKPARMVDQLAWLRKAGFKTTVPFWQSFCFAAYKDPESLTRIER